MSDHPKIVCFGEILWDVFPTQKKIGGAPLNVALRFHRQGHKVAMVSRLGDDTLGKEVQNYLQDLKFPLEGIQVDEDLSTGEVLVTLNPEGAASYIISQPVAWDAIALTSEAKSMVTDSQMFLFGSLASRELVSRNTLLELLKIAPFSVFDVNLRPPHYTMELITQLMASSNFTKMNDEELVEICKELGCTLTKLDAQVNWLMDETGLSSLCVTKGAHGALLYHEGKQYAHEGFSVKVEDTVGAGDSFLATLLGSLLFDSMLPELALERACAVGALVASKEGANCDVVENEIQQLISNSKKT